MMIQIRTRLISGTIVLFTLLGLTKMSHANPREYSANPNRSFLAHISLGVGFDLDETARSPLNQDQQRKEAYNLAGFVIGIELGYRINEIIAFEIGWHEQQHRSEPEWGNRSGYMLGTASLRLAWPLKTRQTPLLKIGPSVGKFSYGASSPGEIEDNNTLAVGGHISLTLEHELVLGIVATIGVCYSPLYRRGMDSVLELVETSYNETEITTQIVEEKDFTKESIIHLLWITVGIQFEWSLR